MPNIRGPSSAKRAVLCGVAQSIILYKAPIGYPALNFKKMYKQIGESPKDGLAGGGLGV